MERRVEDKLDKVADDISQINATLVGQAADIRYHIKRTDMLEAKIQPIEKHIIMFNGVLKFIGAIALFIGIIEGLLRIFAG